jgi:hypothetical protein
MHDQWWQYLTSLEKHEGGSATTDSDEVLKATPPPFALDRSTPIPPTHRFLLVSSNGVSFRGPLLGLAQRARLDVEGVRIDLAQ